MKKRNWREPLFALALVLCAALLLQLAGAALRPAHDTYGSTWRAYLAEPPQSVDVLYLGSSYAYCDINPAVIYDETGLTGYVMGGSEQTLALTYWYLREALRTQSPSAVVLEISGLWFKPYQAFTQINVGYMPFSPNKLGAVFTASEPGLRLGLLWDLYFYHSRWKEVTPEDLRRALSPAETDFYKGFTPAVGVFDQTAQGPFVTRSAQPGEVYADNLAWLGKIAALCREEGITPVFTLNPTYSQRTPAEYARAQADVEALGAVLYDWSCSFALLGLDPTRHLYDGGHLNREGAEIFSRRLGRLLADELGLSPRPQSGDNAAAWAAAARHWLEEDA